MRTKTILILGGTRQAIDLARALSHEKHCRIITSLAGRTKSPTIPEGELRVGGFGGWQALSEYLVTEEIDLVIDATHPFAAVISENAMLAAERAQVERVMLQRPAWQPHKKDQWESFSKLAEAAKALESHARCFLTIGRQELEPFSARKDVWFLVRMIDAPQNPLPLSDYQVITGMPLADVRDEKALMQEYNIDTLVSKNSGGILSAAKLEAARELGIRVLMIDRPRAPEGDVFESVDALVKWFRSP